MDVGFFVFSTALKSFPSLCFSFKTSPKSLLLQKQCGAAHAHTHTHWHFGDSSSRHWWGRFRSGLTRRGLLPIGEGLVKKGFAFTHTLWPSGVGMGWVGLLN